jgi:hypothetical protein
MSKGKQTFRRTDLKRAIAAVRDLGLTLVGRTDILPSPSSLTSILAARITRTSLRPDSVDKAFGGENHGRDFLFLLARRSNVPSSRCGTRTGP